MYAVVPRRECGLIIADGKHTEIFTRLRHNENVIYLLLVYRAYYRLIEVGVSDIVIANGGVAMIRDGAL
jgi:hypothetical protein